MSDSLSPFRRWFPAVFVMLAAVSVTGPGCGSIQTQIDYAADLFPAAYEVSVLPLEPQDGMSPEDARAFLQRKLNAGQYGLALQERFSNARAIFDYDRLHVTLCREIKKNVGRKQSLYVLEIKNFCGDGTATAGSDTLCCSLYYFTTEAQARTAAEALLCLGAQPCAVAGWPQ